MDMTSRCCRVTKPVFLTCPNVIDDCERVGFPLDFAS